jgi:hypothetical protein
MQNVAIFPVVDSKGAPAFRAVATGAQSEGRTAGEALDALTSSLATENSGTVVLIQPFHPDRFFSAEQQARLARLMSAWRAARDGGIPLSAAEQAELNALAEAELQAATERTAQTLRGLGL